MDDLSDYILIPCGNPNIIIIRKVHGFYMGGRINRNNNQKIFDLLKTYVRVINE